MTNDMIPVFFAANENYFQHLCVALLSLLENNKQNRFVVTVLVDGLMESRPDIEECVRRFENVELRFETIEAGEIAPFRLSRYCPHVSPQTYYRFLIPRRYPQWNRALYLDCDILVEGDLSPLWTTPLGDDLLAGADVSRFRYIADWKKRLGLEPGDVYLNAGVLLMNLEAMRDAGAEHILRDRMERFADIYRYNDQDAINHGLRGRLRTVSPRFNWTHEFSLEARSGKLRNYDTPVIHHFSSRCKPWTIDRICRHEARNRYFEYLAGTPYRDFIVRYNREHPYRCVIPTLVDGAKDIVRKFLPEKLLEAIRRKRDEARRN